MKSFRFSPGRAALLAGVMGVSLTASANAAVVSTLLNPDFSSVATNNGTNLPLLGLLGGYDDPVGTGPWRSYGTALLGILAAPTTSIGGGTANVLDIANVTATPLLNNAGGFYQLTTTNWQPNTVYTLTVDIASNSPLVDLAVLTNSGLGVSLYSDSTANDLGTDVINSMTASPANISLTLLGDGTDGRITLTYTTGGSAPANRIGVRLFAGEENGIAVGTVLGNISFDNVVLDATPVPEPSGTVLGLGALGFLALNRRRKH